jgi:cystathionine beta-lyase/cystathionine gamma-synthase
MPDRFDTRLIHAGELHPRIEGAATLPIFQSTVFEYDGGTSYADIPYPRLNNLPNHRVLGAKLASLEGAEAGLVTASGMAAITTTLLSVLGGGGHLLAQDTLYGGTHGFAVRMLGELGIEHDFFDPQDPKSWQAKLRPNTRAIYVEAITNPLVEVADHRGVVEFARANDLVSIVDATFASPVNFRPIEHGFDVVVHSATKYLNGHSDIAAGAVAGSAERVEAIRGSLNLLGATLDTHACFLLHRGLKTLGLRVRQQNQNALAVARHLAAHSAVAQVRYPGLEEHPQHARAAELFDGFGGMLAFELAGGDPAARALMERVRLPVVGPSLGGCETLLTRPSVTSHASVPAEQRRALGITDGLVRMSVGIEAAEDLIADLDQALA